VSGYFSELTRSDMISTQWPAPAPAKRKLPSASAMLATTSSWARPGNEPPPVRVDEVGTKYHNVAPPAGVRAEDGVMGGGGDYIRPDTKHSLDATKVHIASICRFSLRADGNSKQICIQGVHK
jgi:hypothetical protein